MVASTKIVETEYSENRTNRNRIVKMTFREKLDNLAMAKLDKGDIWKHFDDLDEAKKWALEQDRNLSYKFHLTGYVIKIVENPFRSGSGIL